MSATITIPAERLAGWQRRWAERITPGLLAKAAAGALQALIMRHLQKVARERHDTANRLGATPTGFWAGSAQAVRLHTHTNDAPGATADAPRGAGQAPRARRPPHLRRRRQGHPRYHRLETIPVPHPLA